MCVCVWGVQNQKDDNEGVCVYRKERGQFKLHFFFFFFTRERRSQRDCAILKGHRGSFCCVRSVVRLWSLLQHLKQAALEPSYSPGCRATAASFCPFCLLVVCPILRFCSLRHTCKKAKPRFQSPALHSLSLYHSSSASPPHLDHAFALPVRLLPRPE